MILPPPNFAGSIFIPLILRQPQFDTTNAHRTLTMAVSLVIVSSTNPLAKPMAQHELLKKPVRRVSFDETLNETHDNTQWSLDDCKLTWYNHVEYQQMKDSVQANAKQIFKRERRMMNDENSYTNTVLRVYDYCCAAPHEVDSCGLTDAEQEAFNMIMGKSNTRSGLEKICIREIAYDKRQRRIELTKLLLTIQASHQVGQSRTALMRLACQNMSRASRLFAREMAKALEASLQ